VKRKMRSQTNKKKVKLMIKMESSITMKMKTMQQILKMPMSEVKMRMRTMRKRK
jgi:hypothetical protein